MDKDNVLFFNPDDPRKENLDKISSNDDLNYVLNEADDGDTYPIALKLRLEITDEMGTVDDWAKSIIQKYGKSADGTIRRDILVPADMDLHALHYLIQRVFGWQNSHLRNFRLPDKVFDALVDGKAEEWGMLCGVYFRFPDDLNDKDFFWDDDYEDQDNFKNWLKSRYAKLEHYSNSIGDSYLNNQKEIGYFSDFVNNDPQGKKIFKGKSFDDLSLEDLKRIPDIGFGLDHLLERLALRDILCVKGLLLADAQKIREETNDLLREFSYLYMDILEDEDYLDTIDSDFQALRKARNDYFDVLREKNHFFGQPKSSRKSFEKTIMRFLDAKEKVNFLSSNCFEAINEICPDVSRITNEITYNYDYGDGWVVKITCEDEYTIRNDEENDEFVIVDAGLKEVSVDLADMVTRIMFDGKPVCLAAEGVNVMDDVGGIYGYANFLRTLNEGNRVEASEIRDWAKSMGWSGRSVMPKNML